MLWTGLLQMWGSVKTSIWKLADEERNNIALAAIVLVSFAVILPGFRLKNSINKVPRTLTSRDFVVFPHAMSLCSFWTWALTCALSDACGREFMVFNSSMAAYELLMIVSFTLFATSQEDREKALTWWIVIGIAMVVLSAIFFVFYSSGVTNAMQFLAAIVGIVAMVSPLIAYLHPYNGWLGDVAASEGDFVGGTEDKILLFVSPINALLWTFYASEDPVAVGLKVQAIMGFIFGAAQLFVVWVTSLSPYV